MPEQSSHYRDESAKGRTINILPIPNPAPLPERDGGRQMAMAIGRVQRRQHNGACEKNGYMLP